MPQFLPAGAAMKHPRLALGILAAIHLALGVVVLGFRLEGSDSFWLWAILPMALPAQGSLLGLWVASGSRTTPFRVMLVVVIVAICKWVDGPGACFSQISFYLFFGVTCYVTLLALFGRLVGLAVERSDGNDARTTPLQFSVADLLAWTTAVAVCLSALHYHKGFLRREFYAVEDNCILAVCSCVAFSSVWLVLGRRWVVVRVLCLVAALGMGAGVLRLVVGYLSVWHLGMLLAYQVAWLLVSLAVVRLVGYRLVWRWRLWGAVAREA